MQQQTILVTGGAGYIGSHTAHALSQQGYKVIILDNFIYNQSFDPDWATVIKGSIEDTQRLNTIFTEHKIDAVMHFAAFIEVGKSVQDPAPFYQNNVANTLALLQAMREHAVNKIIFSSSCAVYGPPQHIPLTESHPYDPISPYGKTKRMVEQIFQDFEHPYGIKYVILRYFNAAGAYPEHNLGEQHEPETHIIPLLLRAAVQSKTFDIFGADYETQDGTAVRDYVHVRDIANAHIKAFEHLNNNLPSDYFNLGTGNGISVSTMIEECETIVNKPINVSIKPRREGDPAQLIADPSKANSILNWYPQFSDPNFIITSAYQYMQQNSRTIESQQSELIL